MSALLFTLVTYHIIDKMQKSGMGYRDEHIRVPVLFYVDDSLILARTKEEAVAMVGLFERASRECGLILNRNKCKMIIFGDESPTGDIAGIEIVKEFKYLGVLICGKQRCFKEQINESLIKAEKLSNITYEILGKCYNRLLIGKTYWKGVALPSFLYGQEVIVYNTSELENYQRKDNKAYRMILELPKYCAVEFLRGEIGASSAVARDMRSKILYLKHILTENGNAIVKKIVQEEIETKESVWIRRVEQYMQKTDIDYSLLLNGSKGDIKRKINEWDTKIWREGMERKSTLDLYRNYKMEIREEKWYANGHKWVIMMKARSNTLRLRWREWGTNEEKQCQICRNGTENLEHFLVTCVSLENVRSKYIELMRPRIDDNRKIMMVILMLCENEKSPLYYVDLIWDLWRERKKLMEMQAPNLNQ